MKYTDMQYAKALSTYLERFTIKREKPFLANFRCCLCGDSKNNPNKARGYIFARKHDLAMKCHNCSASMPLTEFIKCVDESLYDEFMRAKSLEGVATKADEERYSQIAAHRL